jgi:excinuclease ABC subunit B
MAVVDDPTAKHPSPAGGGSRGAAARGGVSRPHKPHLDEMGIATWHEVKPARGDDKRPRKPTLDEMGPGVEAIPATKSGPRSTLGKPGMRGGFKPRRR